VLFGSFRVDQDIINVTDAELVQELMNCVVNTALSCCGGISQSNEYDQELKQATTSSKGCLPFITFLDVNLIEACS